MNDYINTSESAARESLSRALFRAGAAHPYLREPIEKLERVDDPDIEALATDGARLYCPVKGDVDEADAWHLLMHLIFRHPLSPENAVRPLWDLACDISAEYLQTEFFPSKGAKLTQLQIQDLLPENVDPRIAGAVYRALMDLFDDELEPLYVRYRRDDHRYWYVPPRVFFEAVKPREAGEEAQEGRGGEGTDGRDSNRYREWLEETIDALWPSEDELPGGAQRTGRYGLNPGSREERMLLREEGRYDFSRYLRRFSTTREERRLDLGSFDYIPYCYGLERYGNMPFVEPLEYAESRKVEELVIAIDTSGSCTRPMVERFFAEIERMLMRHEYFFSRMNVHIVQCDAMVQSHVAIHSIEEWHAYTKSLVIKGRSGTDFTPVFDLVDELIRNGTFKRLKGLIYFTDGDGVYPRKQSAYETAFVFMNRRTLDFKLPEWIIPLCLEPMNSDDDVNPVARRILR